MPRPAPSIDCAAALCLPQAADAALDFGALQRHPMQPVGENGLQVLAVDAVPTLEYDNLRQRRPRLAGPGLRATFPAAARAACLARVFSRAVRFGAGSACPRDELGLRPRTIPMNSSTSAGLLPLGDGERHGAGGRVGDRAVRQVLAVMQPRQRLRNDERADPGGHEFCCVLGGFGAVFDRDTGGGRPGDDVVERAQGRLAVEVRDGDRRRRR